MVAMMNKNLIQSTVSLPIVGETNFFSKSLRFNLELIFFRECSAAPSDAVPADSSCESARATRARAS